MFEDEKDEIVSESRSKPPQFWDHVTIALAEYLGTTILIFVSCMGACLGMQGEDRISSMHTSFTAGLTVAAAIQTFGPISGAHINPSVSLNALIVNQISWLHLPSYIIPQLLGSLTGSALFEGVTNSDFLGIQSNGNGVCVNSVNDHISVWQGFAVEIVLSIILNLANCASWDPRNSDKLDSVSLRIGLLVVVLNLGGGVYTGASMNPARSFGPAVFSGDYKNHWVYWIGPTLGSVIASVIYKTAFLRNRSK